MLLADAPEIGHASRPAPDDEFNGYDRAPGELGHLRSQPGGYCSGLLFAPGPSDPRWPYILAENPLLAPALSPVEVFLALALQQGALDVSAQVESEFCGLADGTARWLVERRPRLQLGGNGVVPLQCAAVLRELAQRLDLCQT